MAGVEKLMPSRLTPTIQGMLDVLNQAACDYAKLRHHLEDARIELGGSSRRLHAALKTADRYAMSAPVRTFGHQVRSKNGSRT